MDSNRLILIFDGITLQHAGELLFDTSSTSAQRTICSETYIRCLEDFAFALLYGANFAHMGSFPKVHEEEPGLLLCRTYDLQFLQINTQKTDPPELLLKEPSVRLRLSRDMEFLDLALQRQRVFWEHWMIREAGAYLGNDDSIYRSNDDPNEYKFARSPQYPIDRQLQHKIPKRFIEYLSTVVRRQISDPLVSVSAIHEFVSRNALTHQLLSWWLELVAQSSRGIRLPHITRALVRTVQLSKGRGEAIRSVRDILARHALLDALLTSSSREDVVHRLQDLREQKPYPMLRSRITDLFAELDTGRESKATQKLLAEIRRLSLSNETPSDHIKVELEAPLKLGTFKLGLPIVMPLASTKRILRQISKHWNPTDYLANLDRVFPELSFR